LLIKKRHFALYQPIKTVIFAPLMKQYNLKELKEIRIQRKMKITEMSKITGISRNLITRIENGKGNPSFTNVCSIVYALGLEVRILYPSNTV
jgi:transcriptional regulator with XRE-family HTH domain